MYPVIVLVKREDKHISFLAYTFIIEINNRNPWHKLHVTLLTNRSWK